MSTAIVKKSALYGTVQAPSSKSVAHRIMICAALSRSKCYIKNVSQSNDMDATISCLETLGAKFTRTGSTLFLDAGEFVQKNSKEKFTLNCKESGTTLRIMIPICAALGLNVTFIGEGRLPQRPLDEYLSLLPLHGVSCTMGKDFLPLTINGRLNGEHFEISPKVSSQYVTGLLLALSLLDNDTTLKLTGDLVGSQYVDITADVMRKFGVSVSFADNTYTLSGAHSFCARAEYSDESIGINVEGDWSQAAFFLCAGAISGDVTVTNLDINSRQGDKAIVDILKAFGANIELQNDSVRVTKSALKGAEVDALDTPDLVPVVAVLSSYADGNTNIYGVERLKFKESDRLLSTSDMINSLGGEATYTDSCMTIIGKRHLTGGNVQSYNDHRIVMASAVGALLCDNDTVIQDAQSVNKSYTDFFDDYNSLGGKANVDFR